LVNHFIFTNLFHGNINQKSPNIQIHPHFYNKSYILIQNPFEKINEIYTSINSAGISGIFALKIDLKLENSIFPFPL
jgi:hypothetical protein